MMKKLTIIWLSVLIVVIITVATTTASLAIWQKNDHNSTYVKTPITDENASLKYQMYVPVRNSGESSLMKSGYTRLNGTYSVSDNVYSYTLASSSDFDNIDGFSLAGWYGGVAVSRLELPDQVTVIVNNIAVTKPVVRAKPESDYLDYSFGGVNTAITEIIIGKNVIEVGEGAFFGMEYLEYINIVDGDKNIFLYPYCFGYCTKLKSIDNHRPSIEGGISSFYNMGSFES